MNNANIFNDLSKTRHFWQTLGKLSLISIEEAMLFAGDGDIYNGAALTKFEKKED